MKKFAAQEDNAQKGEVVHIIESGEVPSLLKKIEAMRMMVSYRSNLIINR